MESEAAAIRNLKVGSLYNTIAIVLAIILEILNILIPKFLVSIEFLIVSLVDYFVLIYGFTRIRYGFFGLSRLRDTRSDIGTTGISVFIFGIVVLLFSDIFYPLIYLGGLLVVVGDAMIGIAFYNIGRHYKVQLESIAGILIALTATSLAGYILSYIASNKIIEEISKIPPKPPVEIKVSDKGIGFGILKSSGLADFKVYSNSEAEIVSVKLQGFDFQAIEISPKTVKPGENSIKAKFNLTVPLTPGNIYNVELLLSNNEKLLASLVYEM